jgi:hypothetical protein
MRNQQRRSMDLGHKVAAARGKATWCCLLCCLVTSRSTFLFLSLFHFVLVPYAKPARAENMHAARAEKSCGVRRRNARCNGCKNWQSSTEAGALHGERNAPIISIGHYKNKCDGAATYLSAEVSQDRGPECDLLLDSRAAMASMACKLRVTSASVVAQEETLMRMALRPLHSVPPHQQVPSS